MTRGDSTTNERAAGGGGGVHDEPKPPFPEQHQPRPGLEADMTPRPRYRGSSYRPAGKLEGRVALMGPSYPKSARRGRFTRVAPLNRPRC